MKPKPLTQEKLIEIHYRLVEGYNDYARELVEALLEAEAYWREIVKNCEPWVGVEQDHDDMYIYWLCEFGQCETDKLNGREHKPDCPWKLANES